MYYRRQKQRFDVVCGGNHNRLRRGSKQRGGGNGVQGRPSALGLYPVVLAMLRVEGCSECQSGRWHGVVLQEQGFMSKLFNNTQSLRYK